MRTLNNVNNFIQSKGSRFKNHLVLIIIIIVNKLGHTLVNLRKMRAGT
jgi:hypothetical protein